MADSTLGTVKVAELLGGTRQWIHKLIKRGELQAEKVGRDWRIDPKSVDEYLGKHGRKGD